MLVIGICGASGSGKTTLAREIVRRCEPDAMLLTQDAYYRDHSDLPFEERVNLNYDEPNAFDHDALYEDIRTLLAGRPITRKGYDFTRHLRADSQELLEAKKVLVIEGIHAFYDERLRDLMDFKIYMNTDPDICLLRRIKRDIVERGRDIEGIEKQYLDTVRPMYIRYIRGYSEHADIIVTDIWRNPKLVDMVMWSIQYVSEAGGKDHAE